MTAVVEFFAPPAFDTLTQKLVSLFSGGVTNTEPVAPGIGSVITPDAPRYHWYASGAVPVAWTLSCAVPPAEIRILRGCTVMVGAAMQASVVSVASAPKPEAVEVMATAR